MDKSETTTETLSETCKAVSKSWPIQVAWKSNTIPFPTQTTGPFLIVKVGRKIEGERREKLLNALRKGGLSVVLMDDEGYYAPFKEAALNIIKTYCDKNPPMVVWRSPKEKMRLRGSGRGKRFDT